MSKKVFFTFIIVTMVFFVNCSVRYSQVAYDNMVKVEKQTLTLTKKYKEKYSKYPSDVKLLNKSYDDSIILEKGRESLCRKNSTNITMWQRLKNKVDNFLSKWQRVENAEIEQKNKFEKVLAPEGIEVLESLFENLKKTESRRKVLD